MTAMVIGVGNPFRRDDGIGQVVIERLRRHAPPGVRLALTDGEPARLLDLWDGTEVAVVIDAVHRHDDPTPGRIHQVTVARSVGREPAAAGSHGLGLGSAIDLALALDRMPGRLVLLAVEGGDFELGVGVSAPVAAAADRLVDLVLRAVAVAADR